MTKHILKYLIIGVLAIGIFNDCLAQITPLDSAASQITEPSALDSTSKTPVIQKQKASGTSIIPKVKSEEIKQETGTVTASDSINKVELFSGKIPTDKAFAHFVKYKAIHDPSEIYFNVLNISNNSQKPFEGQLKFSFPEGWKRVMAIRSNPMITLRPGEQKNIPIRLSMPKNSVGGIAYVISVELVDEEDIPLIPAAYTYAHLPRISDWKLTSDERYVLINEESTLKQLNVTFENKGNAEENIKLKTTLGSQIQIAGIKSKEIESGITIPPYSDTTLSLDVEFIPSNEYFPSLNDNRVMIEAQGEDDVKSKNINFWFEKVRSVHRNKLIEDESPLVVWADAFNIVTNNYPVVLQAGVKGTLLLKDRRRFQYFFFNPNIFNTGTTFSTGEHYYTYSRMFVRYITPSYTATLGDIVMSGWFLPYNGRGGSFEYHKGKYNLFGAVTQNVFSPVLTAGMRGSYQLQKDITLHGGLTYRKDDLRFTNTIAPSIGATVNALNNTFTGVFSTPLVTLKGTSPKTAYAHMISISSKRIERLKYLITSRYTSDWFLDVGGELLNNNVFANYKFKDITHSLNFNYNGNYSNRSFVDQNIQKQNIGRRNYHVNSLLYNKTLGPRTSISTGPGYQYYTFDHALTTTPQLKSHNYNYTFTANRRKTRDRSNSTTLQVGYTDVTEYDLFTQNVIDVNPYINASVLFTSRFKKNGIILGYYYGAPSFTSQRYLNETGRGSKSIRINPYFNFNLLDNRLTINSNIAAWYYINNRISRVSFFNFANYDLGKGWSATGNFLLYYFRRADIEALSSSYFDFNLNAGIKKVFDFNQPRQSYEDVEIIFFKDLNGNKIKDENEVGIPNVMVTIDNKRDSMNISASEYFTVNLMSDRFGRVACERIPSGLYTVTTQASDQTRGEYINQLGEMFELAIDNDLTQYVPYIKSNKIYGSINLKRDEFSAQGFLSVANIRITATDSLGNTYASLSDKQGDFILFVPQSGLYSVRVNNVFGEDFKLRQEEFKVDFNGLKEFKVSFLFEEGKRNINFKGDGKGINLENKFKNESDSLNSSLNNSDSTKTGSSDTQISAQEKLETLIAQSEAEERAEIEAIENANKTTDPNTSPQEQTDKEKLEALINKSQAEEKEEMEAIQQAIDQGKALPQTDDSATPGNQTNQSTNTSENITSEDLENTAAQAPINALFNDPNLLERPINKDMIFFKVQVGAYNTSASQDQIAAVKTALPDVEISPTPQGLTRLCMGEFKKREDAIALREQLLKNENIPNKGFVVVVGEYFGKFLTADEAEALLNSAE